ncbi:PAS domain S-box protein [Methanoregula sp.]|uniref:response regulator n=1 Tax=Methanoregula sp. TaxID=2052170 RepID=UPI003C726E54
MYSILYVDDDEILLSVNKIYLEKNGDFSVDLASSATIALERIPAGKYDAILSDYQMPGMDGIALLKEVRQRHGNLPFILFTGKGREEVVMEALNHGADFYVQKGPDLKGMIAELKYKLNRAIERRRIGDDLKRSRQQMTDIINFLPDATFVIDTRGRVIAWNHAIEKMTGCRKEDILGKGDYEYAIPFFGERMPMLIDTVLQDPPALNQPCSGLRLPENKISQNLFAPRMNGGRGAHLWVHAGPLCDADGIVEGAIETIRDISDVHRIKHDLDQSLNANRGFANILPVGVYEIDLVCQLTFANTITYEMFGLVPEDFNLGINILDYIADPDRERAFREIQGAAKEGSSSGKEYLLQKSDGSTFPALIYGAPVIDPETKQPVGLRGVIIDLTRRKQEALALFESEERLKLILAGGDIGVWDVEMRNLAVHDIYNWCHSTLGYDFEPGKPLTVNACKALISPHDLPKIISAFYRHVEGKTPLFESNFRAQRRDGLWVRVTVRGKVIERTADGEPLRITGMIYAMSREPESDDPLTRSDP